MHVVDPEAHSACYAARNDTRVGRRAGGTSRCSYRCVGVVLLVPPILLGLFRSICVYPRSQRTAWIPSICDYTCAPTHPVSRSIAPSQRLANECQEAQTSFIHTVAPNPVISAARQVLRFMGSEYHITITRLQIVTFPTEAHSPGAVERRSFSCTSRQQAQALGLPRFSKASGALPQPL